jgi:hypothetical protein
LSQARSGRALAFGPRLLSRPLFRLNRHLALSTT